MEGKQTEGISLRDYFAAQAMDTAMTAYFYDDVNAAHLAKCVYAIADAMLAEREKQALVSKRTE